jgi:hypothetical protein
MVWGMKQILLVLLVLAFSVPAVALVYIYNIKSADTGMYYDGYVWEQYKDPYGGYCVVGPGSDDTKVNMLYIWVSKDKSGYHYFTEDHSDVNLVTADIPAGKKTNWTWVISDANDQYRTMLSGAMKVQKIGKATSKSCLDCHSTGELATLGDIDPNIPSKMTGYAVWDYKEYSGDIATYIDMYTSQITLSLNSKKTYLYHDYTDAVDVRDDLIYEIENP